MTDGLVDGAGDALGRKLDLQHHGAAIGRTGGELHGASSIGGRLGLPPLALPTHGDYPLRLQHARLRPAPNPTGSIRLASLLRFSLVAVVVVALLVFVAVPILAGPILGSMVRDAGFPGKDLHVDVNLVGAGILSGRAASVRVQARDVNVPHGSVGDLDLTLHDVSAVDHSFSAVSGTLHNITVNGPSGIPVVVNTVDVDGPAAGAQAHGTIDGPDAEHLVSAAAAAAGVGVDSVKLGHGRPQDQQRRQDDGRASCAWRVTPSSSTRPADRPCSSRRRRRRTGTWRACPSRPASIQVDLEVDVRALASALRTAAARAVRPAGTRSRSLPARPTPDATRRTLAARNAEVVERQTRWP